MADTKKRTEVLIIRETLWKSTVSDIVTYVTVVGVIGTGWWLSSAAMQWCGFLMLGVSVIARSVNQKRLTVPEARKRLDEIEQEMKAANE